MWKVSPSKASFDLGLKVGVALFTIWYLVKVKLKQQMELIM